MTPQELEALMIKQWGPDFREKALVGPTSVFYLADVFEECGLVDPKAPIPAWEPMGLMQPMPFQMPTKTYEYSASLSDQLAAMTRYVQSKYGDPAKWEIFASEYGAEDFEYRVGWRARIRHWFLRIFHTGSEC